MIRSMILPLALLAAAAFPFAAAQADAQGNTLAKLPTKWTAAVTGRQRMEGIPPPPDGGRGGMAPPQRVMGLRRPPRNEDRPQSFDGRILVPFPIESALSGAKKFVEPITVSGTVGNSSRPPHGRDGACFFIRAVDWEATVWVNGRKVAFHEGGYDPFTADITSALTGGGPQELIVAAWDPSDAGFQPRGKQVLKPEGIWYTPTTGIWQTVWLEPVNTASIEELKLTPDVDAGSLRVTVACEGVSEGAKVAVKVMDGGKTVAERSAVPGATFDIPFKNPKLLVAGCAVPLRSRGDAHRQREGRRQGHGILRHAEDRLGKDAAGRLRLCLNQRAPFPVRTARPGILARTASIPPRTTRRSIRHRNDQTARVQHGPQHVKIEPDRCTTGATAGTPGLADMPSGDK